MKSLFKLLYIGELDWLYKQVKKLEKILRHQLRKIKNRKPELESHLIDNNYIIKTIEDFRSTLCGFIDLDPELYSNQILQASCNLPIVSGRASGKVYDTISEIWLKLDCPIDILVLVSGLSENESNFPMIGIIRAASKLYSPRSIFILQTDSCELGMDRDQYCQHYNTFRLNNLVLEEKAEAVQVLIRASMPRSVINIDSQACWVAFRKWGEALNSYSRLYTLLQSNKRSLCGWGINRFEAYLRDCFPYFQKIYCDDNSLAEDLIRFCRIPESLKDKIIVLNQNDKISVYSKKSQLWEHYEKKLAEPLGLLSEPE